MVHFFSPLLFQCGDPVPGSSCQGRVLSIGEYGQGDPVTLVEGAEDHLGPGCGRRIADQDSPVRRPGPPGIQLLVIGGHDGKKSTLQVGLLIPSFQPPDLPA